MEKPTFLTRLQYERDKFELLLNQVGFARQLTMKGVSGNLSVKDLLADVLSRELFIADRLSEILLGETYHPSASLIDLDRFHRDFGYPDYESPLLDKETRDQIVIYRHLTIGLDDIIEQDLAVFTNILQSLEKLTSNQFLDHDLYHRVAEHTYKPYRRVSQEIRFWRRSIAAEGG